MNNAGNDQSVEGADPPLGRSDASGDRPFLRGGALAAAARRALDYLREIGDAFGDLAFNGAFAPADGPPVALTNPDERPATAPVQALKAIPTASGSGLAESHDQQTAPPAEQPADFDARLHELSHDLSAFSRALGETDGKAASDADPKSAEALLAIALLGNIANRLASEAAMQVWDAKVARALAQLEAQTAKPTRTPPGSTADSD